MFRFMIRDVLWSTVVVAMGVSWWTDHRRIEARANGINSDLSVSMRLGK